MTKRGKKQLLIAIVSIVVLAMMIGLVYLITEKDQANKDGEKYMFHSESSGFEESSSQSINNDIQQDVDTDKEESDSDEEPDTQQKPDTDKEETDTDKKPDTNKKEPNSDKKPDTNKEEPDSDKKPNTDKEEPDSDKEPETDTENKPDTQEKPAVKKPESYAAYAEMTEQEQEKLRNDLGSKGFNNWLKEVGYDMQTYNNKSEDEQQTFRDSFEKPGDFVAWYWTAHDAQQAASR